MTSLTILRYPHAAFATPCLPVTAFDADLEDLADRLYQAMIAAPGVGITAAHCGIFQRIVILDLPELGGRRDFINPEILSASEETMTHVEGSVSMPGFTEEVTRPRSIILRYQRPDGSPVEEESLSDFAAICMQHEIDQLDGIFWIKRLSRLKRERLLKRWQKAG
ncbi:peptide deformylase [Peteryoungia ipomoeae]|uniref:Peptide deformylase-like n=1 Tax=Peteryoungia ipomoeae TaxID=1210932 RepID=A0A4S8PAR9_9HYPH|nr:peptide deformylase [Peteryoungia ipomoeae]THV25089.1 peptide deformylase [Peteryoungia ipomoeae]